MAENSKIKLGGWLGIAPQADLVRQPMAALAEGDPVSSVKTQIRIFCERPYVVCIQIAATIIAAMSTRKSISQKNIIAPALQFGRVAKAAPLNALAIDISRSVFSPKGLSSRSLANLFARFASQFDAAPMTWPAEVGEADFSPRFSTVNFSLKGAQSTLCALFYYNASALKTRCGFAIVSRYVARKNTNFFPLFAFCAALQTICQTLTKFINGQAALFCGDFQCSFGGLGHGCH